MTKPKALETVEFIEKELRLSSKNKVILNRGLNLLEMDKSSQAEFDFEGQTLVNILGKTGDCEDVSLFNKSNVAIDLDSQNRSFGSNSFKITANAQATEYYGWKEYLTIESNAYYVLIGDIKTQVGKGFMRIIVWDSNGTVSQDLSSQQGRITSPDKFTPNFVAFKATNGVRVHVRLQLDSLNDVVNFDAIRLYKITESEYNAVLALTADQVGAKYPYVSGIRNIKNPYIMQYGNNLLPPMSEWNVGFGDSYAYLSSDYRIQKFKRAASDRLFSTKYFKVIPNTTYTISSESGLGKLYINESAKENAISGVLKQSVCDVGTSMTIITTAQTKYVSISFGDTANTNLATDLYLTNPMFNLGSKKDFEPAQRSKIVLQTELLSNPVGNTERDRLYSNGTEYFKATQYKKVVLDGSLDWVLDGSGTGFKTIKLKNDILPYSVEGKIYAAKYDGTILKGWASSIAEGDYIWFQGSGKNIYLTVKNSDSGWLDGYSPSVEEIKSYMYGWKMYRYDNNDVSGYSGTGTKGWYSIAPSLGKATIYFPTKLADTQFKPYTMQYKMAAPVTEKVQVEGNIRLEKGINTLEFGEGLILREIIKINNGFINAINADDSTLSHSLKEVVNVFKNDVVDDQYWFLQNNTYNNQFYFYLQNPTVNFDVASEYSISYMTYDTASFSLLSNMTYETSIYAIVEKVNDDINALVEKQSIIENALKTGLLKGSGERVEVGTITVVLPANGTTGVYTLGNPTFKRSFLEAPKVFVSLANGISGFDGGVMQASSVTTTGFTLWGGWREAVFKGNPTSIIVNYIAIGK